MSLSTVYKTDSKKETEGVEIKLAANEDGSIPTFVLARAGKSNPAYVKALNTHSKPVQALIRTKHLSDAQGEELLLKAFIDGILRTWKNVLLSDVTGDDSDKGFADFNMANATKLFKRLPDLLADLETQANDVALFREATLEEQAKN